VLPAAIYIAETVLGELWKFRLTDNTVERRIWDTPEDFCEQ